MLLTDRLYGEVEINEPLLLDLLSSASLQRLKGVLQHGISGLIGITRDTTRFEHSVGVMLLVRRLGAGLEQQAAALLHDVSHTAFSHVIDYVFDGHDSQDYHDLHKGDFVATTDLPRLLAQHGYDWCDFVCLDDAAMARRYPLLEQPSPDLCADRLDYFLRDSHDLGLASQQQVRRVLRHLRVHQDRIVVNDLRTARWMGETFIAADRASWANFREVGLYELAAQAIRRALAIGELSEQDLWGTDQPAWQKLLESRDEQIQRLTGLVAPSTRFAWDEAQPTFRVSTKLRTIDPLVLNNRSLHRLSEIEPAFGRARQHYLESSSGKWPMRVIAGN
jgi:HD superfamily phosphohydrolase